MNTKYKEGDRVRIRSDLEIGEDYGDWSYTKDKNEFKGRLSEYSLAKILVALLTRR